MLVILRAAVSAAVVSTAYAIPIPQGADSDVPGFFNTVLSQVASTSSMEGLSETADQFTTIVTSTLSGGSPEIMTESDVCACLLPGSVTQHIVTWTRTVTLSSPTVQPPESHP
ncbi:hypothetical protein B0H16DRAFT_1551078 [Mycena metata]|uniref:Uncharacterized protein n=1 Tax=Mycena metata TaxID=1033252 RepID=A0AAD7N7V1_9AGAR|nr:hypothetical protein B0H16DRAFT_1551078 [Mycena metata]